MRSLLHDERDVFGGHDGRYVAEQRIGDTRSRFVRLQGHPGDDRHAARGEVVSRCIIAGQPARVAIPAGTAADAEAEREISLSDRYAVQPLTLRRRGVRFPGDVQRDPALHVRNIRDHLARRTHQRNRDGVADILPIAVLAEPVAMRPRRRHGLGRRIARLRQIEGNQKPRADLIGDTVVGDAFDDQAKNKVVGIGIFVRRPRGEIRLLLDCPANQRARIECHLPCQFQRVDLRRIVRFEQATAHLAQFADGDVLRVRDRHAESELAQWIIEVEFPLIDQLEQDADDERLGVAADAEMISWRKCLMRCEIGGPVGVHVTVACTVPHADEHSGDRRAAAVYITLLRHRRIDGAPHGRTGHRHIRPSAANGTETQDRSEDESGGSDSSDAGHEHVYPCSRGKPGPMGDEMPFLRNSWRV